MTHTYGSQLSDTPAHRATLRKKLRKRRNTLSRQVQIAHASAINDHLKKCTLFKRSKRIAAYLESDGEIAPSGIIESAWQANKKVYLPILSPFNQRLYFVPYFKNSKMKLNRYGISEPDISPEHWLKPQQLDLILMPLVGFDRQGNRLGMGGGYYDRSLQFCRFRQKDYKPYLIGLAHQLQEVKQLNFQKHDVPMQYVATEQQLLKCK